MPQHDMIIDNAAGASVRAEINLALAALATNSSGAAAPATTSAYQMWADTASDMMKIRNPTNTAWISLFKLSVGLAVTPAFSAYQSVSQPISAITQTPVNFVSKDYDKNSNFSTALSTFTAPVAGVYSFGAAACSAVSGVALQLSICVNGTIKKSGGICVAEPVLVLCAEVSASLNLSVGDAVTVYVLSRVATTLAAGSVLTRFHGNLVRAA